MEENKIKEDLLVKEERKKTKRVRKIKKRKKKRIKKEKRTSSPSFGISGEEISSVVSEPEINVSADTTLEATSESDKSERKSDILEERIILLKKRYPNAKQSSTNECTEKETIKLSNAECTKRETIKLSNAECTKKMAAAVATAREKMAKRKADKIARENEKIVLEKAEMETKELEAKNKPNMTRVPKNKTERREIKKNLREKKKISKLREQIRASKSEKWAENLVLLLQNQIDEVDKTNQPEKSLKQNTRLVKKLAKREKLLLQKATIVPKVKIPVLPLQQNVIATVYYMYQRRTVEVNVDDTKIFLKEYLPKVGTVREIKEIKKEYAKLATAIGSCKQNSTGFIKYTTRNFYSGRKILRIEIKRGRKKIKK